VSGRGTSRSVAPDTVGSTTSGATTAGAAPVVCVGIGVPAKAGAALAIRGVDQIRPAAAPAIAARRTNSRPRADAITDEIIERVGLGAIAGGMVGRLSHGLRQWVELGTVLAGNPELILLDEPAAGMTHDEVARTAELVREINRTHALIVVEHDMQFVRMIARTVTVMHQGAVLVEDTMDQILKNSAVRDIYLGKHGGA